MRSARVLVVLVVVVALTACGGDDAQAFCDAQIDLEELDPQDAAGSEALDRAVETAPDEIADDVQEVSDALDNLDNPDQIDAEAVQAASERISDWIDENCEEG